MKLFYRKARKLKKRFLDFDIKKFKINNTSKAQDLNVKSKLIIEKTKQNVMIHDQKTIRS